MDILGPSLSALRAFTVKMNAGAANVANANTDGYQAVTVELSPAAGGGVIAETGRDQRPGPEWPSDPGTKEASQPRRESNVDLARELTDLAVTEKAYQANARAIRLIDETRGSLLDIIK